MAKTPQWIKEGFRPHGPGHCRCGSCGTVVSTNAFARSSHRCPAPKKTEKKPEPPTNIKAGDATFMKCVGYGYTTYERGEDVVSVRGGKIKLENRDYPFNAITGKQICDLPDLGLQVSLCVTDSEIEKAKRYITAAA